MRYDVGNGKCLLALHDISAGEEISINYLSDTQLLTPRPFREDSIRPWGFACACPRCSQQTDDMRFFTCPKRCGGNCTVEGEHLSACKSCQAKHAQGSAKKMFAEEKTLVESVMQFDKNPFLIGANPGILEKLIIAGEVALSPMHWIMGRLHDCASSYFQQVQNPQKALQHMTSELAFWESHMKRPSQQAAWKRKLRADVMTSLGNFPMAFREYSTALAEITMVMPTKCHHCDTIHENLQETLAFRTREELQAGPGAEGCQQQ